MRLAIITYIVLGVICEAKQLSQSSILQDENLGSNQRSLGSQLSSSGSRRRTSTEAQSSTYRSGKVYDGRASKSNGRLNETNHRGGYINRSHTGDSKGHSYWPTVDKESASLSSQKTNPLKLTKSISHKSSKGKGSANLRDRYYYKTSKSKDLYSDDFTKFNKSSAGNGRIYSKGGKGYYRGTNKKYTGVSKKSYGGYAIYNHHDGSGKGYHGPANGYSGRSDKNGKGYFVSNLPHGPSKGYGGGSKKGGKGYLIPNPPYGPSKGYDYGPSKGYGGGSKKSGKGYIISNPPYGPSKVDNYGSSKGFSGRSTKNSVK